MRSGAACLRTRRLRLPDGRFGGFVALAGDISRHTQAILPPGRRKKRIEVRTQWDFSPFAHDAPVFPHTHMRFRQNYGGLCHTRSRNISLSASLAGAPFPICAAQARRLCPKQPVRLALSHNPKP